MIMLENKKVLFVAPRFYNYHTQIIDFMESYGADVTFFAEDIYTSFYRFLNRVIPKLANLLKNKYRDLILTDVELNNYDYVFVIRGGILTQSMMEKIKSKLINARFIMYQWDSNKQSNYKNIIKYFDIVKTFDQNDANYFQIKYLPLYYSKQYEKLKHNKSDKEYDIVFYGAYHSDRLSVVKYISNYCIDNNLKFKYHLYITKMGLVRLLILGILKFDDLKYLKTYSVDMKSIINVYKQTYATLDIELNIQNGLTMRTFETLGSGLKLITTNKNIEKEPFFNKKNIIIIDRDNLDLDLNFFKKPFYNDLILEKYSFENWFNNLFEEVK